MSSKTIAKKFHQHFYDLPPHKLPASSGNPAALFLETPGDRLVTRAPRPGLNTGSILLRNSGWTRTLVDLMCQYATADAFEALRPVGPGGACHLYSQPSDCMPRQRKSSVGKGSRICAAAVRWSHQWGVVM